MEIENLKTNYMPALSYKDRFVDFVEEGLKPKPKGRVKRTTIREFRVNPFKKGQKLYHYFAQRNPKLSRKLGESIAKSVRNIIINHHVVFVAKSESGYPEWRGDYDEIKDKKQLDKFALNDGFENWDDMKQFWIAEHGEDCFPFNGFQTKW